MLCKLSADPTDLQPLRKTMQAMLGLCLKGKLDSESLVHYFLQAKQSFPPHNSLVDEFG